MKAASMAGGAAAAAVTVTGRTSRKAGKQASMDGVPTDVDTSWQRHRCFVDLGDLISCVANLWGMLIVMGDWQLDVCTDNANKHHHHQITKLSHSINAIGPAPHRSGRKREHRSIVFATITHIPSLHKIRNANKPLWFLQSWSENRASCQLVSLQVASWC
jgi:hypothetical protein